MEKKFLKIKINKQELSLGIKKCLNVIEGNTFDSSAINECIKLKVEKNIITLTSFSHLFCVKYEIKENFEIFNDGEILIKGKIFYNIISKLDDEIILERIDNNSLYIKSNNFESNLNLIDEYLFPEINFKPETNFESFTIKSNYLDEIENKLINFVSKTDNILSYINFSIKNNILTATATDSVKLANINFKVNAKDNQIKIHPLLLKWLSGFYKNDEDIEFKIYETQLIIKYRNLTIINNIWNDVYPNTDFLLNSDTNLVFNIEKNKILKGLERGVSLFDSDPTKIRVKLLGEQNELIIKFENEIYASSMETIEINKIIGGNIDIVVNAQFLIQIIKNFEGDIITIKLSSETKNILFNDNFNDNFIQLLAPISVS